jgi:hypothetical protein
MAPEHLRAISAKTKDSPDQVREPADLHSLAILLWELWQGHRPFATGQQSAASWDAAVEQQLQSRQQPLPAPQRTGSATERVLEKTLRLALSFDAANRPQSGAEMAGRLRLALHPNAAKLLDPGEQSLRWRLTTISPWIVVGLVILLPNIAAGFFNYEYNEHEVNLSEPMKESLKKVATCVNSIAYPLAVATMIWFTRGLVRAMRAARQDQPVSPAELHETIDLGHRAAIIGGTFWMIAGLIYPIVLRWMHPEFTSTQMAHFFVSLLICGGVAMIYPFFGMALVSTLAYYPRLLNVTMQDSGFDFRAKRIIRQSELYLLGAAIIPLLGAALIISGDSQSRGFMLSAIAAGVVGLLAAWLANRVIAKTWTQMGEILSQQTPVVPGEAGGAS